MDDRLEQLHFSLAHFGVNCRDAAQAKACAALFSTLFGLPENPAKESADATFTTTQIEWMKAPGRGEHGHIGIATSDLPAARRFLEERGIAFDDASAKFFPDGRMLVIYAREDIGGFALHLMQRE